MITTTIRIDEQLKADGVERSVILKLRGKFSEYVETLIKADLKKNPLPEKQNDK